MGDEINVSILTKKDFKAVSALDERSSLNVAEWLDSDEAYGIFKGSKLAGYCTLGCADSCEDLYGDDPDYSYNALVLSNVYVKKEFRHQKLGRKLITTVINSTEYPVYLQAINEYVKDWYKSMRFETINDERMKFLSVNYTWNKCCDHLKDLYDRGEMDIFDMRMFENAYYHDLDSWTDDDYTRLPELELFVHEVEDVGIHKVYCLHTKEADLWYRDGYYKEFSFQDVANAVCFLNSYGSGLKFSYEDALETYWERDILQYLISKYRYLEKQKENKTKHNKSKNNKNNKKNKENEYVS